MTTTDETRWDAYLSSRDHVSEREALIMEFLRGRMDDGGSDDEISVGLMMPLDTAKASRFSLWEKGLIYSTGETRLTRHHHPAVVWAAIENPLLAVPVVPVKFQQEAKNAALDELLGMFTEDMMPPAVVHLVEWLRYKKQLSLRRKGLI